MQSFYTQREKQPSFILRPCTLKKLFDTFQNYEMKAVEINAICRGSILHKFESLDELLQYENPKSNEIVGIDLFFISTDPDQESLAKLRLVGGFGGAMMDLSIDASSDRILTLKKNINDIFSGIRTRYHFLTPSTIALLTGLSSGLLISIVCHLWAFELIKTLFNIEKSNKISEYIIQLALFVVTVIPLLYTYVPIVSYLLPRGVFAIGQGASRFEFQQKVLKWVIGIFTSISLAIIMKLVLS